MYCHKLVLRTCSRQVFSLETFDAVPEMEMDRKEFIKLCGYGLAFFGVRAIGAAEVATPTSGADKPATDAGLNPIELPKPQMQGGKPLMDLLKNRKSSREFSVEKISLQTLSNLLWAAFGVNRPDGKRTAPTAHNWREIDIYVAIPEGTYVYNAEANRLDPVVATDLRAMAGTQSFVAKAPLNLIYVADLKKTGQSSTEFSSAAAGCIGQNVYLFCASEGLAAVFRASINVSELAKALKLRPEQKVLYSHTVGIPKA